ncbi:MAG: efflux RND transporter periplasmic adaptor subunit, partial [Planctomycetota bacterium]
MLSAEVDEKIDRILVEEGDKVEEGEKLLEFDSTVIDARIKVAELEADYEARINQARTQYEYRAEEYRRREQMGEFGQPSKKRQAKFQMRQAELSVNELKRKRERAAAQLESLKAQAAQYTVSSPINGVVSTLKVEEGEMAEIGTELMAVVNPDLIEIPVHVPEKYLPAVEAGQPVSVRFIHAEAEP